LVSGDAVESVARVLTRLEERLVARREPFGEHRPRLGRRRDEPRGEQEGQNGVAFDGQPFLGTVRERVANRAADSANAARQMRMRVAERGRPRMPDDPLAQRRLGGPDRALGVVEACERSLRGGRAFAAGAKRSPPFVRARERAAVYAKIVERELAPRAVERKRGALAS